MIDIFAGQQRTEAQQIESEVQATKLNPNIAKIIEIFQDPSNQFFASAVSNVGVSVEGSETLINVLLDNGISIEINLRADDLNITIRGINVELQTAMDNQAHQQSLRDQLQRAGFTIHQITTVRGDQPIATPTIPTRTEPATPETPEGEPGGDTGGEAGAGEEEGPPER